MFGGLHIEMGFLKVLGQWLNGSGWIYTLTEAKVLSPATAESFIKASNVVRTRNAYQVTVSSLYILLRKAYEDYVKQQAEYVLSFDDWCSKFDEVSSTISVLVQYLTAGTIAFGTCTIHSPSLFPTLR
jgi:hypothetical protein